MSSKRATVGVAEHGNSAELVTLAGVDGALLDRRRIDLTRDLPTHPYHHEGAWALGARMQSNDLAVEIDWFVASKYGRWVFRCDCDKLAR